MSGVERYLNHVAQTLLFSMLASKDVLFILFDLLEWNTVANDVLGLIFFKFLTDLVMTTLGLPLTINVFAQAFSIHYSNI